MMGTDGDLSVSRMRWLHAEQEKLDTEERLRKEENIEEASRKKQKIVQDHSDLAPAFLLMTSAWSTTDTKTIHDNENAIKEIKDSYTGDGLKAIIMGHYKQKKLKNGKPKLAKQLFDLRFPQGLQQQSIHELEQRNAMPLSTR